MLSVLVGLCVLDYYCHGGRPGVWLAPVAVLVSVLATAEVLSLLAAAKMRPIAGVVHAGTLLIVLAAIAPTLMTDYPAHCPIGKLGWPTAALAVGMVLAFVGEMRRFAEPGGIIPRLAASVFARVYVGILLSFTVQLRFVVYTGDAAADNTWGMVALLSMIAVVKGSDAGAYAAGRLWGRHKLAPRISPAKTVEGAIGGLLAGVFGSWLMLAVIAPTWLEPGSPQTPWWGWLSYGILVALAGMVGDLAESLLKRDVGVKDSSRWLPGLGGALDVLDSVLFAAPVAYALWILGVVGPRALSFEL